MTPAKRISGAAWTDVEVNPGKAEYELMDGTIRAVPMREAWVKVRGREEKVFSSDFSQIARCPRCDGHANADGFPEGGILILPTLIDGLWYFVGYVCECLYGAFIKKHHPTRVYYDSIRWAPPGLSNRELGMLRLKCIGGITTLRDAAENVNHTHYGESIRNAVMSVPEQPTRTFGASLQESENPAPASEQVEVGF